MQGGLGGDEGGGGRLPSLESASATSSEDVTSHCSATGADLTGIANGTAKMNKNA